MWGVEIGWADGRVIGDEVMPLFRPGRCGGVVNCGWLAEKEVLAPEFRADKGVEER